MSTDRLLRAWARDADGFTSRSASVPPGGWDAPSPCEGWTARDIVRHLTSWVPPFLAGGAGVELGDGPSVDDDPHGAWCHLDAAIRALLDDPVSATSRFEHPVAGSHSVAEAIDRFVRGDVLIHTWDLARATGQPDHLDREAVSEALAGMEPMADVLASSGHYKERVVVDERADDQTKLIALSGRDPTWSPGPAGDGI